MIKVKKGKVRHRGESKTIVTELGVLLVWFFYKILLPECNGDKVKARYRFESFADDALRIAMKITKEK